MTISAAVNPHALASKPGVCIKASDSQSFLHDSIVLNERGIFFGYVVRSLRKAPLNIAPVPLLNLKGLKFIFTLVI